MSDETLRRLERRVTLGDPAAEIALGRSWDRLGPSVSTRAVSLHGGWSIELAPVPSQPIFWIAAESTRKTIFDAFVSATHRAVDVAGTDFALVRYGDAAAFAAWAGLVLPTSDEWFAGARRLIGDRTRPEWTLMSDRARPTLAAFHEDGRPWRYERDRPWVARAGWEQSHSDVHPFRLVLRSGAEHGGPDPAR